MTPTHLGSIILSAFLASAVEFIEALTVILAVAVTRGWRSALIGATAAAAVLLLLVIILGPVLGHFPIQVLRLAVGGLLLLFGMRWLRKAILRAAGSVSLRDEADIYRKQTDALSTGPKSADTKLDWIGFLASFKAVLLEGLEVVFIVIALGATANALVPAGIGAAAAGVVVIATGLVLHKPLERVPENSLKFTVGVLLSAFGTFWIGEGLGLTWFGQDASILGLIVAYAGFSWIAMLTARTGSLKKSQTA
ncbi:MAG: hypothetical protein M3007_07880 [Candidatus Eremiobacteraeota bacterium]|nr:hypothetical protein [Candidatus Eremiobacteraeota bacterium]